MIYETQISRLRKGLSDMNYYTFGAIKRLYEWTLNLADTKYGAVSLFLISFLEASLFPIPPDILLIALCSAVPKKSFRFAAIATAGSVIGGVFGYYLGWAFYDIIGYYIIHAMNYETYFNIAGKIYAENAILAILAAALTPIPYKVFTIASGFWKIDVWLLIMTSLIGRGLRFYLEATLIFLFGAKIKTFIDRHFNTITMLFFIQFLILYVALEYLA